MNVLYLINYAGKGGTEKYIRVVAERIKEKGDSCFLVYNEKGPLVEAMASLGAETIQMDMKSPLDMKAAEKLAEICKKRDIHIIHTQFARENYIALLAGNKGSNAKVIHTTHINMANNIVWKMLNRFFMKKNEAVIAVCTSIKKHLIENKYPESIITVIPNGIDYNDSKEQESGIYEEFGIDRNTFLFVTLTRFSAEKGIFFLLDGINELKKRCSNFKVLLAGDGPLLKDAQVYAEEKGISERVVFLGYRTDPDNILGAGDCFINSSQTEASSFAILEAMGAGLPIIASNVGGNPDIVNADTNCGILVEYNNAGQLAEAMAKMMNDHEFLVSCGRNAKNAVKDTFNIETVFNRTYAIYEKAGRR